MAIPLIINGVTFQYPQTFDKNWGPTLTNWSSAVTSGMLQKAGGSFTLTAEVDFGGSFGMKVLSVKSEESNIATTGFIRLGNASPGVVWRNALHSADLALTVNASNQLTFNGTAIGATTSLTNSHILVGDVSNQPADVAMSGDITITNAGVTALGAGKVLNANVNASAAIAWSKLATGTPYNWLTLDSGGVIVGTGVTASKAIVSDANGLPSASATTATELGYVGGVTSAIQTQINAKVAKAGDTMAGVLNMGSNKIISLATGSSAGDAVAFSQLKVISVGALVTSFTPFSTASSTPQATGFSASITPSSASNRVLIIAMSTMDCGAANVDARAGIYRGTTNLGDTTDLMGFINGVTGRIIAPITMVWIDSPATTSAVTYNIYLRNSNNATTVTWGASTSPQVFILAEIV